MLPALRFWAPGLCRGRPFRKGKFQVIRKRNRAIASGALAEVGSDQLADFAVDQRPERIAAQAGERAEGDRHRAIFTAQQPGADARYAIVAAAGDESVDRVVRREGQGDVAQRDEGAGPGQAGCHECFQSRRAPGGGR